MHRTFIARLSLLAIGVVSQGRAAAAAETLVYENRFDQPPQTTYREWSSSTITHRSRATGASGTLPAPAIHNCESPNKKIRFLGEFGGPRIDPTAKTNVEQSITLALNDLPPHTSATVSFDLYILHSWDGDSPAYGPDRWWLEVVDGPKLLDTTFSNNPKTAADGSWQSYPRPHQPPQTRAVKKNTLGSNFFGDSTYHFSYEFDHADKALKLRFGSSLFEGKGTDDEAWGLDNVSVSVKGKPGGKTAKSRTGRTPDG